MKVHYGEETPACGVASFEPVETTVNQGKVTCLRCQPTPKCKGCQERLPASEFLTYLDHGQIRRRRHCKTCQSKYGDNSFTGFGIDLCRICGGPTRDHELRWCDK